MGDNPMRPCVLHLVGIGLLAALLTPGLSPTADKGVFISVDKESGGTSLVGPPGKPARAFGGGDWMIRALVDQPKTAARTKRSK
jgi:hypothetical protein